MRQHQESPIRPSNQTFGQVLAAEGSGDVESLDLPGGLFAGDVASEGGQDLAKGNLGGKCGVIANG